MKTTITQIKDRDVTTKFGVKKTYSFKGSDGQWYNFGFKKLPAGVGDEVEFDFSSSTYGNNVEPASFSISVAASGASPTGAQQPQPSRPPYTGNKGVFPIPALDGQRSIVRQNALTNARELIAATIKPGNNFELKAVADSCIQLARLFEAYTAGDLDLKKAKEELHNPATNADIPE